MWKSLKSNLRFKNDLIDMAIDIFKILHHKNDLCTRARIFLLQKIHQVRELFSSTGHCHSVRCRSVHSRSPGSGSTVERGEYIELCLQLKKS